MDVETRGRFTLASVRHDGGTLWGDVRVYELPLALTWVVSIGDPVATSLVVGSDRGPLAVTMKEAALDVRESGRDAAVARAGTTFFGELWSWTL
jgi:hypothetical protein